MHDLGMEAQDVAHRDGLLEQEGVHRDRGHLGACPPRRRDRAGDVDHGHDPAPEHVARRVEVGGHRHHPQHEFLARGRHQAQRRRVADHALAALRIDRDVGQARLGDLDHHRVGGIALGEDMHVDRDRRLAHRGDVGVEADDVADRHRLLEDEGVHRHRHHPRARLADRGQGAGDVHHRHDPAAEHVARRVEIGRHRHHAQGRQRMRRRVCTGAWVSDHEALHRAENRTSRRKETAPIMPRNACAMLCACCVHRPPAS